MNEFNIGDKVAVRRGKHRGPATICSAPDAEGQYAVTTLAGHLLVTNSDNLKAPDEVTIGAGALTAVLSGVSRAEPDFNDALEAVVDALNKAGVQVEVSYTHSLADTSV